MGEDLKQLFKKCGKNVKIYPLAKIINPEKVEIDDYSIIDDFTFIEGGKGIKIGKYVHISNFTSIIGGGKLEIGNFSGVSAGCRIITGTDDFLGNSLTGPCVPKKYRTVNHKDVLKIGKHAILGTNTIVHPNITIGQGAVTGSNTLVTKNLEPWTIYIGSPARKLKNRSKRILQLEKQLLKE
jgi:galactoside O-acetyltransferase